MIRKQDLSCDASQHNRRSIVWPFTTTLVLLFIAVLLAAPTSASKTEPDIRVAGNTRMYWTQPYKILRAATDGSAVETLLSGCFRSGIALDLDGGKMYWLGKNRISLEGDSVIQRANLDGSEVEDLLSGLKSLNDIALDAAGGKMYWSDGDGLYRLHRANLDGSEVEDLISGIFPKGIALDTVAGKVYWADVGMIRRANLDGTEVETVLAGPGSPRDVALDVIGSKMYWTETDRIRRANLDGSAVETLYSAIPGPSGIALDLAGSKMYWTERFEIRRANLDGSGMETLVVDDFYLSNYIVLDVAGGAMYWTNRLGVQRANLDGSGAEIVVGGACLPHSIALDVSGHKMYWSVGNGIMRANLDGSEEQTLLGLECDPFYLSCGHIALDVAEGKLYWVGVYAEYRATGGEIRRANLDGTEVETILRREYNTPSSITLDTAGDMIYWTEEVFWTGTGAIRRASMDGSGVEAVLRGLSSPIGDIALDLAGGRVYWIDGDGISRANLDGSGIEPLISGDVHAVALDTIAGQIYWTEASKIRRARLDGSGVEDLLTGLDSPRHIALDLPPTPPSQDFMARLNGSNEVPPTDTAAKGLAGARLNGKGTELRWEVILRKIEGLTSVHIHCAPAGENGPIGVSVFDDGPISIPRFKVYKGVIRAPDPGNACGWLDLSDVVAAMESGEAYVNVHTLANPAGEIRGQIREVKFLPSEIDL